MGSESERVLAIYSNDRAFSIWLVVELSCAPTGLGVFVPTAECKQTAVLNNVRRAGKDDTQQFCRIFYASK